MTIAINKSIKIIPSDQPQINVTSQEVGGKAANLFLLKKLGFNVPSFVSLPFQTLTETVNYQLIADDVEVYFSNETRLAVRSSANVEDHGNHSFAGQFESLLFVEKKDLAAAIKTIFESAKSAQVKTYCEFHKIELSSIKMSIVVQEMIDADVSGVGFGVHPLTGNPNEKVINATWGIGEGLVSGALNSDLFEIAENGEVKTTIANKKAQFAFDFENEKLAEKVNPKSKQNIACLSDNQLNELSNSLQILNEKIGSPQDIEFAVFNNEIYYLQTRPVTTTVTNYKPQTHRVVWDNSNIVESYPGVTLPMTFSFIRRVYEVVYKEFSSLMGVSDQVIEKNEDIFKNMLGLINGQAYYNLINWYRSLALLPGYSINARYMETMMGVKESFDLPAEQLPSGKNYWGLIRSVFKMIKSLISLPRERDAFLNLLDNTIKNLEATDFENNNAAELLEHYENLEGALLKNWKAPLVNDFFAMIFYGLLKNLTTKWKVGNREGFHNELLAGSNDIISVEPIHYLENVMNAIDANPSAKLLFEREESAVILEALNAGAFPKVAEAFQRYIAKFGDRSTGELKLETITYRQKPELFIQFLKNAIGNDFSSIKRNDNSNVRSITEAIMNESLKGRFFKKIIFKKVLKYARQMVSNRENLRFERTRAFGQVRRIFSAIGKFWSQRNILENERDIFYLSVDEINDFIKGRAISTNLKGMVALRRTEFDQYAKNESAAERIETFGTVFDGNDFFKNDNEDTQVEGELKGTGCSPGYIEGRVQVVTNPQEIGSLNGDILVASCTDPSWVTLFPTAAAVIVERGSMLSHSAIVAREMGIPCIVGVSGLLQKLKTGDRIKMNGSTGEIEIV